MTWRLPASLRDSESGATLVEFALILLPLCIVLIGSLDIGYQSYVRSTLQGALNDVARFASVENPRISTPGDTLEERVENAITDRMRGLDADGSYRIVTSNYGDFSGYGQPERLVTDVNSNGRYDDGDCWQDSNPNGQFDLDSGRSGIGGASDVVFYDVTLTIPRILPLDGLIGVADHYEINAKAAVRSQPYANQRQPEVRC